MSNGDDQPQSGFAPFPRSPHAAGGQFDQPIRRASPLPPSNSVFDDPTVRAARPPGRILVDDPGPAGPNVQRSVAGFPGAQAPPFASVAAVPHLQTSGIERLLEAAYRWRTVLGLGLATVMTLAIVVAYRGANNDEQLNDAASGASAAARTAPTTPGGPLTPGSGSKVASEVDEIPATGDSVLGPSQSRAAGLAATTSSSRPRSSTTSPNSGSTSASDSLSSATSTNASSSTVVTSPTVPGSSVGTSTPPTSVPGGSTTSSASTSSTPPPAAKVRLEAEEGQVLGQAKVASDHLGFSGAGFVSDLLELGQGVSVTVAATPNGAVAPGSVPLRVRYSAGNPLLTDPSRTLTLRVNGVEIRQLTMQRTKSWNDWASLDSDIALKTGNNTITLIWADAKDTGNVNIDYFELN
jgi:hypothetical protein